jgi:hypothetical protein
MVEEEYDMFSSASSQFATQISYESYQIARLNVMTRSFGTGELTDNAEAIGHLTLDTELAYYKEAAGVDLSQGCHAMVPILDQYNHHAKPNIGFAYDTEKQSWIVTAIADIPSGSEIFDSYGKRTDSDLFAKYGFVNGDGSEYTQASLALWHENSQANKLQLKQMLRYLQYDDGYESCVTKEQNEAWELKQLKFMHLLELANKPHRWVVRMPPRDNSALPGMNKPMAIQELPAFDMRQLQFDGTALFATCRLITLTHYDYSGTAVELLRHNLHNDSFILPNTRDSLEFRTLMCIARMAQTALSRFGVNLEQQESTVRLLNKEGVQTRSWTVAHLRLGEMQTLEALKQTAFAGLRPFEDKINSEPAFSMRDKPCPPKVVHPLLDEVSALVDSL